VSVARDNADFELRSAIDGDAYALWLWANDEHTRSASFGRAPITWAAHVRWFTECLRGDNHVVLMAILPQRQPAGVIRFETADGWRTARLSYVVAPEQRGRRLAAPLVEAASAEIRRLHPSVVLRADVAATNARSLHVFRSRGWTERPGPPQGPAEVITFALPT
jgi:GNAT superfamily N-acetyltransferase